jgi:hypothetical protein
LFTIIIISIHCVCTTVIYLMKCVHACLGSAPKFNVLDFMNELHEKQRQLDEHDEQMKELEGM